MERSGDSRCVADNQSSSRPPKTDPKTRNEYSRKRSLRTDPQSNPLGPRRRQCGHFTGCTTLLVGVLIRLRAVALKHRRQGQEPDRTPLQARNMISPLRIRMPPLRRSPKPNDAYARYKISRESGARYESEQHLARHPNNPTTGHASRSGADDHRLPGPRTAQRQTRRLRPPDARHPPHRPTTLHRRTARHLRQLPRGGHFRRSTRRAHDEFERTIPCPPTHSD